MPAVRKFLATPDADTGAKTTAASTWISEDTSVKLESEPFDAGAMRHCFRSCCSYLAVNGEEWSPNSTKTPEEQTLRTKMLPRSQRG